MFSGCETMDLNQIESESDANARFLDPSYTFNYAQIEFASFIESTNGFTQRVTRQMAMTGGDTYDNAFQPSSFNTSWTRGYGILNAIKIMEPKAKANNQNFILGASKVLRCYTLATLVDVYGDVPNSEALQGNANLNPKYDKSVDVYKAIFAELDEAITLLNMAIATPGKVSDDLYYNKNAAKWRTLAKTLKFKMLVNSRFAGSELGLDIKNEINTILTANDIIDTEDEDFQFRYGPNRDVPNSRHPMYNDQYELGGGAYIANYFMWAMTTEKGYSANVTATTPNIDPRINYYFFKQVNDPSNYDDFVLPRLLRPLHYDDAQYTSFYFPSSVPTCYKVSNWVKSTIPGSGFWGRDHGDNSGIPPDNELRTVAGVYPIGGAFGAAKSVQTSGVAGALGAGITPILLSSYVHFMKAEVILEMGVTGNAKSEFLAGINSSLDKSTKSVNGYPVLDATQTTVLAANKTFYYNEMSNYFDGQLSQAKKLEIIMKEYFLATWGNGIESYNSYRRTGYPSNFQPTLEFNSGAFYSCALYPSDAKENNPNVPENVRTRKVFWDKNNVILH